MDAERARRQARRRRGILLGSLGLVLTFGPAVSLPLIPPDLAPVAVGLMIAGLVLLIFAFITTPRRA
ncbi:MAG: hypothetical protein AABY08_00550 [Candidatus Thermoplasmatota archaeon]|jgi:hypothetical protein